MYVYGRVVELDDILHRNPYWLPTLPNFAQTYRPLSIGESLQEAAVFLEYFPDPPAAFFNCRRSGAQGKTMLRPVLPLLFRCSAV